VKRLRVRAHGRLAIAAVACAIAAAGCGSTSSSSTDSGAAGSATTQAAATANVSAAQAVVAQYSKPSGFPVDQPLQRKPGASERFAYLDCDVPTCALLVPLYDLAAKTMGISPPSVDKAGPTASDIQSTLASILAQKPAALLLPAINLGELGSSISQYKSANVPIVGAGIMGTPAMGITAPINGAANFKLVGEILADWAITQDGGKANIAWYENPELDFTKVETTTFRAELAKNCSSCQMRVIDVPLTADSATASSQVVSDLRSHSSTNLAMFCNLEIAIGLPAALRTAGIKIKIAGASPLPQNLQDMEAGSIDAAVALDFPVLTFTQIDAAARLSTGQPLTAGESSGLIPDQLITKADLRGKSISQGYAVYPDFVQRFAKLWAGAR
jgi:ABC-type sugar transport system substrate-binding protein